MTFSLETDGTRPSRVSSRLVSCCLDLVSSRLVTSVSLPALERREVKTRVFSPLLYLSGILRLHKRAPKRNLISLGDSAQAREEREGKGGSKQYNKTQIRGSWRRAKKKGKNDFCSFRFSIFFPFSFPRCWQGEKGREAEAAGIEGKIIGSLHPPPPTSENEKEFLLLLRRDKV